MDDLSHQKREDFGLIRLFRNTRNDETLKRVCQHLSVLVAIGHKPPRPKSRNDNDLNAKVLYPPNNTPAEGAAPRSSIVKMNRGKENWKRLSSLIVKRLRLANRFKDIKKDIPPTINNEQPLDIESSSVNHVTSTASSIVTIDRLLAEVLSLSDVSNDVIYESDQQLPNPTEAESNREEDETLGKSVWHYYEETIDSNEQQGPSGTQNNQASAMTGKSRWRILSRTILTLVHVANVLNMLKNKISFDNTPTAASISSVTFIKKPGSYIDSVSTGSFSTTSRVIITPLDSTQTENTSGSGSIEHNEKAKQLE